MSCAGINATKWVAGLTKGNAQELYELPVIQVSDSTDVEDEKSSYSILVARRREKSVITKGRALSDSAISELRQA